MSKPSLSLTSLCEDVILIICDYLLHTRTDSSTPLKDLSLVNHYFHTLLRPLLFKTIHINKPISQLPPLPLSAYHARTFKIDMFGSLWWWCSGSYTSHSDALDIFTCISRLTNLHTLHVSMMKRSIDMFTCAFSLPHSPSMFLLPQVENLIVTSSAAFLVAHCPNLRSAILKDDTDECLLEPYTALPKRLTPLHPHLILPGSFLTHFNATATWTALELANLTTHFPHLTFLRMRSDTYCYHTSFAHVIDILAQNLKDLKTLHLVKSGYLGMGYQALLWKRRIQACGDDEYRRLMWRQNEALRVQVENEVVRTAFGAIGELRECWVGETRVARKCDGEGCGWMWERKCEEGQDWGVGSVALDKFRREKEDVVVSCEMGW
jgi:hypothetical protein